MNLAENGHSPTLYLKHESYPQVAEVLWHSRDVMNLCSIPEREATVDDTFQDTTIPDYGDEDIGSDQPKRSKGKMSYVKRDPRVRRAVISRANGRCERPACGLYRPCLLYTSPSPRD